MGEDEKRIPTDPAIRKLRERAPAIIKIALAVAACVPSFVAYLGATSDAETKAKAVQAATEQATDKAEKATAVVEDKVVAGYQVTRAEVEQLKARVVRLERAVRSIGKKTAVSIAVSQPASAPLPPTLEQAVQQVKAAPTEPAK